MSILNPDLCQTLTQSYIDLLKAKNISKTTDFIIKDVEEIVLMTGIPYKDALCIRNTILAKYGAIPVNGMDFYNSILQSTTILSFGSKQLDDLLDGGLFSGEVTEVVGDIGSGKTQLCFTMCATTAIQENQTVVYIDTGASFSARRLIQMIDNKCKVKTEEVLSRIQVCDAFTIYDVFSILEDIAHNIHLRCDPFYSSLKLVVLDNIASLVYPFLGGGSIAESQGLLNCLGNRLKSLAAELSLAILLTNNLVKNNGTNTASLGRLWSHVPHVRFIISKEEINPEQITVYISKNCRGMTGKHNISIW